MALPPPASLPLDGVTVLDLSQIYNGPYATFLLAMAGARIVKVEPPGGESLRRRGVVGGAALPFAMLNGCKESLMLDLKTDAGKDVLRQLAMQADVVVENFAPGVMDRLGLGAAVDDALSWTLVDIRERIDLLATRLRAKLAARGAVVHDRGVVLSGIVTFSTAENPATTMARLQAAEINVSVSQPGWARFDGAEPRVRASVHYYNTEDEIERFCDAL